jgi:hypothetical protein
VSRQALLVLYDNGSEQVQKDENWISAGLIQRNYNGRVLHYNPDNPHEVASHLGKMAMFLAGHMGKEPNGNETREPENPEDVKLMTQIKRALGPALRELTSEVMWGRDGAEARRKKAVENG